MSKPTVLYIEDYPVVQQIYIDVLSKEGFDVTVASDGKQATELSKKQSYDVILVDLLLPQVNGIEFLKSYRKDHPKEHDKALIIVLTDFDSEHSIKDVHDLDIEHYWIKVEHTPHVVADKIKELLDKQK
jgi:DNA-binding response OmpR family regulator